MSTKNLLGQAAAAAAAAERFYAAALDRIIARVSENGRISSQRLEREQHRTHGLAWLATYVAALKGLASYAQELADTERMGEIESLLIQAAFAEYLDQIAGGIPMNQAEFVRPADLSCSGGDLEALAGEALSFFRSNASPELRSRIVEIMCERGNSPGLGDGGLDETLERMRAEIRRFTDSRVAPHAHGWHLRNDYVPLELLQDLSELGVFALTLPEEFGGLGLGKLAMCVVSEELSRGWIAVGSLGTRAEIASELILTGGTAQQKDKWLPGIASGKTIPCAVFTEPDSGSDLASLRTRAERCPGGYLITGNKTWITHAARADLMTIMARTDPATSDHRGLSVFIAGKPRGTDAEPFPAQGMSGSEIEVLGYRGMKEYEIRFENFLVPEQALLGGVEGQGFRQLMQTFESARIQTAARAVGLAQNAFELALAYARERMQFGKPLIAFPRVANKLVHMAAEILCARQLTYTAAHRKDQGHRSDLEAGMAKLLAARVAWTAADNAVQIHGGNGFALEFQISRVLCDARILNIFEGAAEIQAQIVARRLLADAIS
ncbi:MAG TPA: acyl-CoA dehydrogenase family protein [Aestuariivirgaceae bacterium]